jgi:hypothetical protein
VVVDLVAASTAAAVTAAELGLSVIGFRKFVVTGIVYREFKQTSPALMGIHIVKSETSESPQN